jgi:hypothetical protein
MSERIIESVGILTKKEHLSSVENETNSNKLILESTQPFPGYYARHSDPTDRDPYSLFALTRLMYNDERIIRCIQAVKTKYNYSFDGAPGSVQYQNETFNFVRFKNLAYSKVGEVLEHFKNAGIEFRKARKVSEYETIIRVRKFFSMKESHESVYQDLTDKHTSYIVLPANLRWNTFEKITMDIKYNMEDKNFDAAQTSVFAKEGLIDFVRIYDRDSCQGKLLHIKEKYIEAISKI